MLFHPGLAPVARHVMYKQGHRALIIHRHSDVTHEKFVRCTYRRWDFVGPGQISQIPDFWVKVPEICPNDIRSNKLHITVSLSVLSLIRLLNVLNIGYSSIFFVVFLDPFCA